METTSESLLFLRTLLESSPPDSVQAVRVIKDVLMRGPCSAEMDEAKRVIELLLSKLIKPALVADRVKQAYIDRLLRQIRTSLQLDMVKIAQEVDQLGAWMAELNDSTPTFSSKHPPAHFSERLFTVLRMAGEEEEWILKGIAKCEAIQREGQKEGGSPWHEIHTLLGRIITKGEIARSSWQREREEVRKMLMDVAIDFRTTLGSFGLIDTEITGVLERVDQSDRITELEELKELLIREAQSLRQQAREMGQQLEKGHTSLEEMRGRLRQMDEALTQARDEQLLDPFTGIPNRFSFTAHFKKILEQGVRLRQEPFCLVLFHLDNYPDLVQNFGRMGANRLIASLSKRIREILNDDSVLARLGDWEFVILIPKMQLSEGVELVEKILAMIGHTRFKLAGKSLSALTSFGLLPFRPGMTEQSMLYLAGQLVNAAKREGKNCLKVGGSEP
ncbi:MAG: GGDEF domain-containing protein [Magnetococcus sp. DMHC-6]